MGGGQRGLPQPCLPPPTPGCSPSWFLWHSCARIPMARRSGAGEACSGWGNPGEPLVESQTFGDSGPREKFLLAGAEFRAGAMDPYTCPRRPQNFGDHVFTLGLEPFVGGGAPSGRADSHPQLQHPSPTWVPRHLAKCTTVPSFFQREWRKECSFHCFKKKKIEFSEL